MAVRLLVVFILVSFLGFSQSPLTKRLSVNFKNIKVETALDEIQSLGRFYFSYNSKVIPANKLITYTSYNEDVKSILDNILGKGYVYKHRGKYLIIQKSDPVLYKKKKVVMKGNISSASDSSQISEARNQKRERLNTSKADVQNSTEQAIQNSRQQSQEPIETVVREQPKIGRNEKVTIKNVMSGEEKEVKYKQAIPLLEKGTWVLYNN